MGVLGLVLLVLACGGLWIWWPRSGFWRGLVTASEAAADAYFDLHALAAAWSALLLFIALAWPGRLAAFLSGLSLPMPMMFVTDVLFWARKAALSPAVGASPDRGDGAWCCHADTRANRITFRSRQNCL